MDVLLVLLLVLLLVGGLPTWGWHSYGYYPSSGLTVVLFVVLLVLLLRGGPPIAR